MPDVITDNEWHLQKTVSIGHIVTTVTVAASLIYYISGIENRVENLAVSQDFIRQEVRRVEQSQISRIDAVIDRMEGMRQEQRQDLQRISDKLDKFLASLREERDG